VPSYSSKRALRLPIKKDRCPERATLLRMVRFQSILRSEKTASVIVIFRDRSSGVCRYGKTHPPVVGTGSSVSGLLSGIGSLSAERMESRGVKRTPVFGAGATQPARHGFGSCSPVGSAKNTWLRRLLPESASTTALRRCYPCRWFVSQLYSHHLDKQATRTRLLSGHVHLVSPACWSWKREVLAPTALQLLAPILRIATPRLLPLRSLRPHTPGGLLDVHRVTEPAFFTASPTLLPVMHAISCVKLKQARREIGEK
jgi:hypothetical protein